MIRMVGALVGCADRADALAANLELELDSIRAAATRLPARPRVYFEEWDDPLISGIRWVEELVEVAGGDPIFPELRDAQARTRPNRVRRSRRSTSAGRDHRVVVREGRSTREDRQPPRLAGRARRPQPAHLRDQVVVHPAAGTGSTDRRRSPDPSHRRERWRRTWRIIGCTPESDPIKTQSNWASSTCCADPCRRCARRPGCFRCRCTPSTRCRRRNRGCRRA